MKLENQVCSLGQAKELKRLGLVNPSENLMWFYCHDEQTGKKHAGLFQENIGGDFDYRLVSELPFDWDVDCFPETSGSYPAFTVSELLKALPFIIRHDNNDYFMGFGHSMQGYRVIYETNKLGLVFNLDDELDREKKALFQTMRSGKIAAQVLAEYLRMLLDSNSDVISLDDCNKRLTTP